MNKVRRAINKAQEVAKLSSHPRKMAALVYKGHRLISIGWNSRKTHPKSKTHQKWQHAEFAALIGTNKAEILGSTIYVVRIKKNGTMGCSKPCIHCQEILRSAGVRTAYFVDKLGKVKSMRM